MNRRTWLKILPGFGLGALWKPKYWPWYPLRGTPPEPTVVLSRPGRPDEEFYALASAMAAEPIPVGSVVWMKPGHTEVIGTPLTIESHNVSVIGIADESGRRPTISFDDNGRIDVT